jgi:hypothetical protein
LIYFNLLLPIFWPGLLMQGLLTTNCSFRRFFLISYMSLLAYRRHPGYRTCAPVRQGQWCIGFQRPGFRALPGSWLWKEAAHFLWIPFYKCATGAGLQIHWCVPFSGNNCQHTKKVYASTILIIPVIYNCGWLQKSAFWGYYM